MGRGQRAHKNEDVPGRSGMMERSYSEDHTEQSIKVVYEEIVIFKHAKNAEVQYNVSGTHNLLSSPSSFIMFKQKPTSIAA